METKLEKLPDTWYIQINDENRKAVKQWFRGEFPYNRGAWYGMINGYKAVMGWNNVPPDKENQISFEDFRRLVLQECDPSFPQKWAIKACKEAGEWLDQNCDDIHSRNKNLYINSKFDYMIYPSYQLSHVFDDIPEGYTEITLEEFKRNVLHQNDFVLPDKWCVKDSEQCVNDWFNKKTGSFFHDINLGYLHYPEYSLGFLFSNIIKSGYTEITLEQFKKYVMKETEENKKIIGYKAPYDMFGGKVKKDTLYRPLSSTKITTYCAIVNGAILDSGQTNLPSEIVEQWEPVYKQTSPEISINNYSGVFTEDYVTFGCAVFNKDLFKDLYNVMISQYTNQNRALESVTLGKGVFTAAQITEIAKYYIEKDGQ